MNTQLRTYEQLERSPASSLSTYSPSQVAQGLQTVMGQLLRFFAPDHTPTVRTIRTPDGEIWFEAYDPVTQQRFCDTSEEALRNWLEQRYNANFPKDLP
ncbi:MAG: hypothetical protein F6K00_04550 [Leptolyngbya sp. SIOISBB]|nr:hypothetical protein [Leptolyngbya sp. SIOISBB]